MSKCRELWKRLNAWIDGVPYQGAQESAQAEEAAAAPEPVHTSGPEAPRHARIRRARPVEPPAPADEAPLPDVPQSRAPAP